VTPKRFLQWVFCLGAAFWTVLMVFHITQEVYFRDFPILRLVLETRHPVMVSFIGVCIAAALAALLVFLLGATRGGKITFTAFGTKFSGPSGPVVLWCVTFLVLMAGMIALLKVPSP
jgi:hypothetical protein